MDDVEALLVDVVAAGANEIEGVDFDVIAKRELRAEAGRKAVAAQDLAPGHIVVSAAVILGYAVAH